jgi:hypothetical protein
MSKLSMLSTICNEKSETIDGLSAACRKYFVSIRSRVAKSRNLFNFQNIKTEYAIYNTSLHLLYKNLRLLQSFTSLHLLKNAFSSCRAKPFAPLDPPRALRIPARPPRATARGWCWCRSRPAAASRSWKAAARRHRRAAALSVGGGRDGRGVARGRPKRRWPRPPPPPPCSGSSRRAARSSTALIQARFHHRPVSRGSSPL